MPFTCTRTRLFGLFGAQLDADGAVNLRSPAFRVDAVADNELGAILSPIVGAAVLRFAATGKTLVAQADAAIKGVSGALAVAQATESQLRASLEQQRRIASDAYASQAAAATAASPARWQRPRRPVTALATCGTTLPPVR
ncbi:MAG: hypothetical protein U0163_19530 [Gemmatimonadaceae bacterium]